MQTFFRRSSVFFLAGALAWCGATAPASAQFSIMDAAAQSVMSSRDFNALLDALEFDAGQRATAGPLFDDAQRELIAARDDLAASAVPGPRADSKELSDHESRKRRAYERMKSAERTFFEGLAAFASPAQKPLVERERLAAARRLVRRTLGSGQAGQGPVRVDLVTSVLESQLSAEDQARALGALIGYQTQLTALLEQALDQGLEVDAKAAKLREDGGSSSSRVEIESTGDFQLPMSDPSRRQASAAFDTTLDKVANAHQQAMSALEAALNPMAADGINAAVAKRIWPRAGMDMRSPRAAFAQMRKEIAAGKRPSEQLAALDAAQPAWLSGWWGATRKACDAENTLRRYGIFGAVGEDTKAVRAKLKEAREERDAANRNAWKALAAIDTGNAGFYAQYTSPPEANQNGFAYHGPGEPTPPKLGGEETPSGASVSTFSGATMIMVRGGDATEGGESGDAGEELDVLDMPIVMEFGGNEGGPISISMGPDGVATMVSDSVGDGMMGDGGMSFVFGGGDFASQLSGARMPSPMTREDVGEVTKALTNDAVATATLDQMYTDYSEKIKTLDESAGKAARDLLSGPPAGMGIRIREDGGEEEGPKPRSIDDLRSGVGKMDVFVQQLGALDDALVADLAAACAPKAAPAQVTAMKEERARERLRQLRYPTSPMLQQQTRDGSKAFDLGAVVRQAKLSGPDRQAADGVLAEWSPAAVGAMEQARGTLRTVSLELLAAERKMFERMERVHEGAGGTVERRVEVESGPGEPEDFRLHQELVQKASKAGNAGRTLTRDARDRMDAALSSEGRAQLLAAWCRAVAPHAYEDKRNADSRLVQALGLPDLTAEQKGQIEALRGAHAAEHAQLTERIGVIAADIAVPAPEAGKGEETEGGPGFGLRIGGNSGGSGKQAQLDRLRFDRSELNERTLRRLRAILTGAQNEQVPALGNPGAGARTPRVRAVTGS